MLDVCTLAGTLYEPSNDGDGTVTGAQVGRASAADTDTDSSSGA